ncbi:MAG TPA: hypothetical protein VN816_07700 [Acidimicrobiales bacterium]|nr:hypothetical protein [Acidimicrobiales bacterium]
MRLTATLDHLGIPRFHHKGHGKTVVLIDAPQGHHHEQSRAGQERWRAASYSDPWPDRA